MLPVVRKTPDHSLLGVMIHGGMPEENVRHNIKLTISGGQNEPRKAIAGCIWALLTHPDQFARVREGKVTWLQVFEEFARWISPIGMSPRRIAKAASVNGVDFAPDDRVFLMFGSANRDEAHFANADQFDLTRDTAKSIAFGAGPHFCAGAAASRAMIADVALPSVFARLKGLALDDARAGAHRRLGVPRVVQSAGGVGGLSLRPRIFPRRRRKQRLHDLELGDIRGRVHVQEDRGIAEDLLHAEVEHHAVAAVQLHRVLRHLS